MFRGILLFAVLITACYSTNPFYLPCNNLHKQQQYLEEERKLFAISEKTSPFNVSSVIPSHDPYFPMSCRNEDGIIIKPVLSHVEHIWNQTHLGSHPKLQRFTAFDNIISSAINMLWKFTGWKRIRHYNEDYMYFHNKDTNDTVFYLHGISVLNGLENLYILNDITKRANVYLLLYHPIFYFDLSPYTHTFCETISNVEAMMQNVISIDESAKYQIIGNSFGTIQITTLCKRYPSVCMKMTDIILTDPVLMNFPYSKTSDIVTYGVFFKHPDYYINNYIVNKLRLQKYYDIFHNQIDWYEWSVDSQFIRLFAKQLVLVIGKYDSMMYVKHSPILDECRVIYTETIHGMVIFEDFMKYIDTHQTCMMNQWTIHI